MNATDARIVLTTAGSIDEARRLARTLVEDRLAACTTLIPAVESIYSWENKIESANEILLLIKTTEACLSELESRLLALHSYKTPEFLVIPVEAGNEAYLTWMRASVKGASLNRG